MEQEELAAGQHDSSERAERQTGYREHSNSLEDDSEHADGRADIERGDSGTSGLDAADREESSLSESASSRLLRMLPPLSRRKRSEPSGRAVRGTGPMQSLLPDAVPPTEESSASQAVPQDTGPETAAPDARSQVRRRSRGKPSAARRGPSAPHGRRRAATVGGATGPQGTPVRGLVPMLGHARASVPVRALPGAHTDAPARLKPLSGPSRTPLPNLVGVPGVVRRPPATPAVRVREVARRRMDAEPRAGSKPPLKQPGVAALPPYSVQKAPSKDTCHAYCLAAAINAQILHKEWMPMKQNAMLRAAEGDENAARFTQLNYVLTLTKEIELIFIGRKECWAFHFGCLVCWGCTPEEVEVAKAVVKPALVDPLTEADMESDYIAIAGDHWKASRDMLEKLELKQHLPASDSTKDWKPFDRVSLAYALAQSVRLGSLENRIDRRIAETRSIPERIAQFGFVSLGSHSVTKMIGQLFVLKNQVNLHTDILDTPDFFWDWPDYEPLYLAFRQHLDVDRRVTVVNQRFEVLEEIFDVLEIELERRNATRLEWVIIFLCGFEAFVMALRLYMRLAADSRQPQVLGSTKLGEMMVHPILGPLTYLCSCLWQLLPSLQ